MENIEELVIKSVKEHTCLYDKTSLDYRDSESKNEAWKQISEVTGYSANECRDVWTKLRNRLLQALKRRVRKPSVSSSKWIYEDEMEFLVPFVGIGVGEDQMPMSEFPGRRRYRRELARKFGRLPKIERVSPEPEEAEVLDSDEDREEFEAEEDPVAVDVDLNESDREADEMDDVDLFYLSVAGAVKKLPRSVQVRVRMRVCQLISAAELRYLETDQHKDTPRKPKPN